MAPAGSADGRIGMVGCVASIRVGSCASHSAMLCMEGSTREETVIHHLSIAARDPKQAAEVLAELMGGTAVPFPPNPGSFFALQLDEHGSGVEVYPAGTELQPGGITGGMFIKKDFARLRIDAFRTQRRDRCGHRANDCPARGMAMLRLQSRPIPCDRGLGRERDDGRDPATRVRERIPGVYPSR